MAEAVKKDIPERLGDIFEEMLGSQNVYFQPPSNNKIQYPCVMFELGYIDIGFADNKPYIRTKRWTVTLIDKNPRSPYVDRITELEGVSFDRHYNANAMNHWVFNLYF